MSNENIVVLDGKNLTVEDISYVVKNDVKLSISKETIKSLEEGRQLVFDLVDADFPIYGFNVGVGWNKDKKVFKDFFQQYNENLIFSHCIGVGPYSDEQEARAVMIARINTMLVGCTGVAPEIPIMMVEMLNNNIIPLIPSRGTVGQGDIGLLAHIGLAMIGRGKVMYKGETLDAKVALADSGLEPINLGPKDGLAIVSSNAYAAGVASLTIAELNKFLVMMDLIYAASLEAFDGSVAPLDEKVHKLRRYKGQERTASIVRSFLQGSYINEFDKNKVHDPLSYRNYSQIHGAVREMFEYTEERLNIQLNTTEDNPCLILEDKTIVPSANFEPLNWVLGLESLNIALSHVSKASCYRTIKLSNPDFTKLPRFLSPDVTVLGFATVQKTFTALDAEIKHLCTPSSMDTFSIAGDMEDKSTNGAYVVRNLRKIIDNLRYIFGLELYHTVQALEYRKEDKVLSPATTELYNLVRESIPFYDKDRNITSDLESMYDLISSERILEIAKKNIGRIYNYE